MATVVAGGCSLVPAASREDNRLAVTLDDPSLRSTGTGAEGRPPITE